MDQEKKIRVDGNSPLFDTNGMFHKTFPSDFRQIRYFTLLVVQKAPGEIKEINLLEQQISELIKNAVKHGNKSDPRKNVQVWFQFSEDSARLIVQDEGREKHQRSSAALDPAHQEPGRRPVRPSVDGLHPHVAEMPLARR